MIPYKAKGGSIPCLNNMTSEAHSRVTHTCACGHQDEGACYRPNSNRKTVGQPSVTQ